MPCLVNEIYYVGSTKATAKSKWFSLSAATRKSIYNDVPSIVPPDQLLLPYARSDDPSVNAAHVFIMHTEGGAR